MTKKSILVTGSAGFLGTHLTQRLLSEGHSVIGFDNFYTGQKDNLKAVQGHDNFTFIEGDVIESGDVKKVTQEIDQIYNLACPASPPHYQNEPVYTWKTSIFGVYNLLELAREKNARIFQASTSEVYGDPEMHPQKESYVGHVNPIGPRACYDEGKRAAETLLVDYNRQYDVDIRIVRIFNTYGPMMDPKDGRVVSNFICQALREEPITIYGDGSQTRSFCYVDDLIEGFVRLMNASSPLSEPVNLGNPGEFTMRELANKILDITGSNSAITHHDLPKDDPKMRQPDISRASSLLDWTPKISLEEGLVKTISWFSKYLETGKVA